MIAYKADPTYTGHFSVKGVLEFRADGTGIAAFTHFGISAPPIEGAPTATFGVSASMKFHFPFKYHLNRDGTMAIAMTPDHDKFQGYAPSGPNAGQRYTVDAFTFSGIISPDQRMLTLTTENEPQHYMVYDMEGKFLRHSYGGCNSGRSLIRVDE